MTTPTITVESCKDSAPDGEYWYEIALSEPGDILVDVIHSDGMYPTAEDAIAEGGRWVASDEGRRAIAAAWRRIKEEEPPQPPTPQQRGQPMVERTPYEGYRSEHVVLQHANDLTPAEAEALIGKTISQVVGTEFGLTLKFADGSGLSIAGHTYSGCALDIVPIPAKAKQGPTS